MKKNIKKINETTSFSVIGNEDVNKKIDENFQKPSLKLSQIKVTLLSLLFFSVLTFTAGWYLAKNIQKTNEENFDLSLMYDVKKILDENFLDTRNNDTELITKQDHIWGAISGFTASYRDPYTTFLPPVASKDLGEEISGKFGGIGVEIDNKNGYLTIVSPLPETPAAKAGLKPKDIIIEIEGKDSISMSSSAAVKVMRGEPGTILHIKVARKGNPEPFDIEIKRAVIEIPTVKTYSKDGVFVIKLFSFTENSPELFFDAVKEFSKTKNKKLIIDMRGNPGGHLFAAVYIAGLFLPEGETIVTEDYGDKQEKEILKSGKYHKSNKTVNIFSDNIQIGILVDGGSASAAEILAGALHDNNRAILLGENTYGKGTVQQLKELENGTSLKFTIARWILPLGDWISYKGIPVDIDISISDEEIKKSRENGSFSNNIDPQLSRAVAEMRKIKSQKDLIKIIESKREELKKEAKLDRKEKLKNILEN